VLQRAGYCCGVAADSQPEWRDSCETITLLPLDMTGHGKDPDISPQSRAQQSKSTAKSTGQVTQLLERWSQGDKDALNSLLPVVYQDLRRTARYYLRHENNARTLQSTALVHEAYLRLRSHKDPKWEDRDHFFAVAAKVIRRILVDHARRKSARKRGSKVQPQQLETVVTIPVARELDLLPLEEALHELSNFDARKARVVEMRFFGGLTAKEIAVALGTTEFTVRRDWNIARAWLYRRLKGKRLPTLDRTVQD
jgi:RNA polymerase sigma factor (TIGR02999 family)